MQGHRKLSNRSACSAPTAGPEREQQELQARQEVEAESEARPPSASH